MPRRLKPASGNLALIETARVLLAVMQDALELCVRSVGITH